MAKTLFLRTPRSTGKTLTLVRERKPPAAPAPAPNVPAVDPLLGKMVCIDRDGLRIPALVDKQVSADSFSVKLAMPDMDGLLIVTDGEIVVPRAALERVDANVAAEKKVRAFEDAAAFEIDSKMISVTDDSKRIVDYQDITITGLASTFRETTPADRDGDYVVKGAFDQTLQDFLRNPVMLADHRNSVDYLIGSYNKVGVIPTGLAVEGKLSNAPEVRRVRFLVAEGHLKAFSIGGFFYYGADGHAIERVKLFEITLIPVPANQDALFFTRSVGMADAVKCWADKQKNLRNWMH